MMLSVTLSMTLSIPHSGAHPAGSAPLRPCCWCFRNRINGHPGNYVRVAGRWRLEEVRARPGSVLSPHRSPALPPLLPSQPGDPRLPTAAPASAKQPPGRAVPLEGHNPLSFAVPPQWLHHRPLHPDGHHHAAQAEHQQRHGVPRPVSGTQDSSAAPAESAPAHWAKISPFSPPGPQGCGWQQVSPTTRSPLAAGYATSCARGGSVPRRGGGCWERRTSPRTPAKGSGGGTTTSMRSTSSACLTSS